MLKVFVSYSHVDLEFVHRLRCDLEAHHVNVWQDERELRVGDSVMRRIRDGIDSSDYFVLVMSEASLKSEWVQRELDVAMTHEIETATRKVLPVLIGNVDPPVLTKGKLYADFTKNYLQGLRALLGAIELKQEEPNVIVSVLIRSRGIKRLCAFLKKHDFRRIESMPSLSFSLEIAGGYFAHMRGDKESKASQPSIFQPLPVLELHSHITTLLRDETFVAFGPWQDVKFKGQGLPIFEEGFFQLPEWRNVLYVLGPKSAVRSAIDEILSFEDLQAGARIDLEIALRWWLDPTFITNAPRVCMEPRYVQHEAGEME